LNKRLGGLQDRSTRFGEENTDVTQHTVNTRVIQKVKIQHGWEGREITSDNPAHSPDLAPSDFHLFLHLKKHLAGQTFHVDEEVKNEVTTWLRAQAAEFYDIGMQKLVPRLKKNALTKVVITLINS
jgi:hypothetical protein